MYPKKFFSPDFEFIGRFLVTEFAADGSTTTAAFSEVIKRHIAIF
jgi:dihydrodipicolinate synthase/N-acetylneuraminate lyase